MVFGVILVTPTLPIAHAVPHPCARHQRTKRTKKLDPLRRVVWFWDTVCCDRLAFYRRDYAFAMNRRMDCPHCASSDLEVVPVTFEQSAAVAVHCKECGALGLQKVVGSPGGSHGAREREKIFP